MVATRTDDACLKKWEQLYFGVLYISWGTVYLGYYIFLALKEPQYLLCIFQKVLIHLLESANLWY